MIRLFETIYPDFTWQKRTSEKVIYLTFDDGPIPEVTPWVLDQLKKYNAKATFFCVGDNIRKHQDVLQQVIDNGHAVGNHTFNHINGWKTSIELYLENFLYFENQTPSRLFRPPYGRIKKKQAREILKTHEIIMWSVLTRDYSNKITPEKCLENAINKTRNGSIVLFHDSLKAQKNLMFTLPLFLKHFTELGYKFKKL